MVLHSTEHTLKYCHALPCFKRLHLQTTELKLKDLKILQTCFEITGPTIVSKLLILVGYLSYELSLRYQLKSIPQNGRGSVRPLKQTEDAWNILENFSRS